MCKYIIRTLDDKINLIKQVEQESIRQNKTKSWILKQLNIPKSSYYDWIKNNCKTKKKTAYNIWNKTPEWIEEKVLKLRDDYEAYRSERSPNGISTRLEKYNIFLTGGGIYNILCRKGKNRELIKKRKEPYIIYPKAETFLEVVCIDDIMLSNEKPRDLAIFNAIDEYSESSVGIQFVSHRVNRFDVIELLKKIYAEYGVYPKIVRLDNAQAHQSLEVNEFCTKRGITLQFIDKGKPQQNWPVEVFNNVLKQDMFYGSIWDWTELNKMQQELDKYRIYYNTEKRKYSDNIQRTPYEIATGITSQNTQKKLKYKLLRKHKGQVYAFTHMLKNAYSSTFYCPKSA